MSDICPVCGCKTESYDFGSFEAEEGKTISVCGYCHKQLDALKSAETADAGAFEKIQPKVRWLDAALEKNVEERGAQCEKMLASLRSRFPESLSEHAPSSPPSVAAYGSYPSAQEAALPNGVPGMALTAEIADLDARLKKVEKTIRNFKRGLLISTVLEIAIPILVFAITAFFFFRSDMWFSLQSLLSQATGGYNIF